MRPRRSYTMPELPKGVKAPSLVPEDTPRDTLLPTTEVLCLNRGNTTLVGMHDAHHYTLPPGHFRLQYATARHLQGRFIVKGTRDMQDARRAVSYIAIVGLDPDEDCQPFTPAELKAFGQSAEGLDRATAPNASARNVKRLPMSSSKARTSVARGRRPERSAIEDQGTAEAVERARGVFTPPKEDEVQRAEAAKRAER